MVQSFWPLHSGTDSRTNSCSLQQSLLASFTGKGSSSTSQQVSFQHHRPSENSMLPSLSLRGKCGSSSRQKKLQPPNTFEATGRENIRKDIAHYGIGSITWGNLAQMGESMHEEQLRQVLQEPDESTDWVGEPAWEDRFDAVAGRNAKRMHYRMELTYFGGQAVAHIPDELWCANRSAGKQ